LCFFFYAQVIDQAFVLFVKEEQIDPEVSITGFKGSDGIFGLFLRSCKSNGECGGLMTFKKILQDPGCLVLAGFIFFFQYGHFQALMKPCSRGSGIPPAKGIDQIRRNSLAQYLWENQHVHQ